MAAEAVLGRGWRQLRRAGSEARGTNGCRAETEPTASFAPSAACAKAQGWAGDDANSAALGKARPNGCLAETEPKAPLAPA
eukprot:CAMPEP_0195101104 /NCGR_PEP_ID=MMETSP0448-20130528/64913_1 /TAXON_ID=66468 /ORGANISM="Heterocapsa triquestra, Strain CCMP 448" /LENGTH=80 /DNA_ID=CAMNT_0040136357 /DNA_START=56 /DNA_END=296 /DNA_ORIENTATION=-